MYRLLLLLHIWPTLSQNNSQIEGRVVHGYEFNQFSYVGFLHFDLTLPPSCGSSLFMVQAVLTAAHCMIELKKKMKKNGRIFAYFGAYVPKNSKVRRNVVSFKIHPKYDDMQGRNNIAVAFLNRRVPLSRSIMKIPLASSPTTPGTIGLVVGWQKQRIDIPSNLPDYAHSSHMKATTQAVIKIQECSKVMDLKPSPLILCTKSRIGFFYKDDVGSGLIVKSSTPNLIGVFSHTVAKYAYYSNVYANRDWIISSTKTLYYKYCKKKTLICRTVELENSKFAGNCSVQDAYQYS